MAAHVRLDAGRGRVWSHSNAWEHVRVEPRAPNASIMNMFTQNPSTVCLEQDDLDGLNVLYPTCEDTVLVPQCFKTQMYLGWVRLALIVGVPLLIILLSVTALHACTICAHERNRRKLRETPGVVVSDLETKSLERKVPSPQRP